MVSVFLRWKDRDECVFIDTVFSMDIVQIFSKMSEKFFKWFVQKLDL